MSRVTRREWYRRVNEAWPEKLPDLSADEAMRAARRLYRFVTGRTWSGPVKMTTGNRGTDIRRGVLHVSVTPRYGRHPWDNLVHELSHILADDGSHGGEHARLERRMVNEVVERGWLDGALKSEAKPEATYEEKVADERLTTLARIDVLIEGWERRARRAANALKKLHDRRKRAVKKLDEPILPPKPRGPTVSTKQRVEALAAEHGIEARRDSGIESNAIWVGCGSLQEEDDPYHGDHYVDSWAEALDRVNVYVTKLTGRNQ